MTFDVFPKLPSGLTIAGGWLTTTEASGANHAKAFRAVLTSRPKEDVFVTIHNPDPTEGSVQSMLTFTSENWNVAQTVTVTGVDDDLEDGDISYTLTATTSGDADYAGANARTGTVAVRNISDDVAGLTITEGSLTTTEAGGRDHSTAFTAVLTCQPTSNVVVTVTNPDTTEGSVPQKLTFTWANWNVAQTVTVTGVDDDLDDGNVTYTLTATTSGDAAYAGTNSKFDTVVVTNIDDDVNSFQSYTLADGERTLVLLGDASINGAGNAWDNRITGNSTANILDGKLGKDTLIGGKGHDTYFVDNVRDVVVELAGEGTDTVFASVDGYALGFEVENLVLQGAAVFGKGNGGNNVISGNGLANDLSGGLGADTLSGGAGADTLTGGDGADVLFGGDGNDAMRGGAGRDVLTGGAGGDTFIFGQLDSVAGAPRDRIADFSWGDLIRFENFDANALVAGRQKFSFVGAQQFSGNAGELRFANGLLAGDVNGDRVADFEVEIVGMQVVVGGMLGYIDA
ncbi:calcium-binding protein [Ramlibacter sp.]|uniref:calcium-binding protein n=1 Tax=Ramlibacter sp. TaxID=1917967 RepID=UPI003D123F14